MANPLEVTPSGYYGIWIQPIDPKELLREAFPGDVVLPGELVIRGWAKDRQGFTYIEMVWAYTESVNSTMWKATEGL